MAKKILRIGSIFFLISFPPLALSFFAYTVLHQVILGFGLLIAAWFAYRYVQLFGEEKRLNYEVFQQAYELKKAHEALQSCLATVPQTKVYYERLLDAKITEECNRSRRYGRPLSLMLIEISYFSDFTETYSSVFSETLVQEFISFLKESIRSVDAVIRYGDSRLVLVLPETRLDQARIVSNRIRFACDKKSFKVQEKILKLMIHSNIISFDPNLHRGKDDLLLSLEKGLKETEGVGPTQRGSLAVGGIP